MRRAGQGLMQQGRALNAHMAKYPGFFPALTALGLGAQVYGEMTDEDDPVVRNAMQSVGAVGGGIGGQMLGTYLGGILGAPLGPAGIAAGAGIGRFAGGALGTYLGSDVGKSVLGGVYDMLAGETPESRAEKKYLSQQRTITKAQAERLQALAPIADKMAQMADARSINVARRNAELAADMNMFNTMNASALNAQQNAAQQQALMIQGLL